MAEDAGLQVISEVTGSLVIDQRFKTLVIVPTGSGWLNAVSDDGQLYELGDPVQLTTEPGDAALVVFTSDGEVAFDSRQQCVRVIDIRSGTTGPSPLGMGTFTYAVGRKYAVCVFQPGHRGVPSYKDSSHTLWHWTYYFLQKSVSGNQVTISQLVDQEPDEQSGGLPQALGRGDFKVMVLDVTGQMASGSLPPPSPMSQPVLSAPSVAETNTPFTLSWTKAVRDPTGGTVTYIVHWERGSDGATGTLASTTNLSTTTQASVDTTYTYYVVASDTIGSAQSASKTVDVQNTMLSAPVLSLQSTGVVGTPYTLSWTASSRTPFSAGQVTYTVHWSTTNPAASGTLTPTTGLSQSDSGSNATTYTYFVVAQDSRGTSQSNSRQITLAAQTEPLSVSVSTTSLQGTGTGSAGTVKTLGSVTASASGGSGTYTYSWIRRSGSSAITPTAASSAITKFSGFVSAGSQISAVFYCHIVSGSQSADTADVTVTLNNTGA